MYGFVHIDMSMYTYKYIHVYVWENMYMHAYIYTHTQTFRHIHANTSAQDVCVRRILYNSQLISLHSTKYIDCMYITVYIRYLYIIYVNYSIYCVCTLTVLCCYSISPHIFSLTPIYVYNILP